MENLCLVCNQSIEENAVFCSKCGTNQKEVLEKENSIKEIKTDFEFVKKKYVGRIVILNTTTLIKLNQKSMSIDQKRTSLGIFKRGSFNTEVDYKDIHDIVLKTTFDKGNLFLIIISTIISIGQPIFFIMTILLILLSLGKMMHICTSKGNYKIPNISEDDINELTQNIKKLNSAVFIHN